MVIFLLHCHVGEQKTDKSLMHFTLSLFHDSVSDMTRHPSTDSTPSDSGSSPSDSGSSPSPSTPQKLLPACTSPFGPRLFHATSSSSGTPRPQPEGSDHRHTPRLSGKLGGHGPCGRHIPVKMERIKVCVYHCTTVIIFSNLSGKYLF